ncbi:MAG: small subunit ribosomal protein S10 [bacterium]|jgi:small subunit ribosomal protein S10
MAQRIRVNFKAYDAKALDRAIGEIASIVRRTGASIVGPIPLPTKKQKFCVLRSPHVNKKSREQFEIRTHKRLVYIEDTTPQTMDHLMKMEVSPGVQVDIKIDKH